MEKRTKKLIIAGLCGKEIIVPMIYEGNAKEVIVIDNARYHKSKKLIAEKGCQLIYLPLYFPSLNKIEKY